MKIVIPGGSGQVGTVLARAFHGNGHDVVVLSRGPACPPWRGAAWDGATLGTWAGEIDGADVVINLAGRSVNCRYTAANRRAILESRVRLDARRRRGDRARARARPGLAAGQHRHDLRAPLRRAERRSHRHHRRQRTGRAGHLAVQHRGRQGLGGRAGRGGRTPRTRKVALRSAMTHEPGPRRDLRRAARPGAARSRRRGRRRPAVHLLDP